MTKFGLRFLGVIFVVAMVVHFYCAIWTDDHIEHYLSAIVAFCVAAISWGVSFHVEV